MKSTARLLSIAAILFATAPLWSADAKFTPPASPRTTYNFNANWKFTKGDVPAAQDPSFDDSKWETVSTPHTFNDVDSFRVIIERSSGTTTYHERATDIPFCWNANDFNPDFATFA